MGQDRQGESADVPEERQEQVKAVDGEGEAEAVAHMSHGRLRVHTRAQEYAHTHTV